MNMFFRIMLEYDALANSIVADIPEQHFISDKDIFVDPAFAGGQFLRAVARRLRKYGHSLENIKSRLFGYESNIGYINHPRNKSTNLIAQLDVLTIEDFDNMNKQFDVVVSNPPFQDAEDSGGTLWAKFADKALSVLVKDKGHVAMIHPPSFIGKHTSPGRGKSDYTAFRDTQIEQLHILDEQEKNKYFPSIGTRICWYIAKKEKPSHPTKIVGYDSGSNFEFDADFAKITFIPTKINRLSVSIHNKLVSAPSLTFKQSREMHYHTMKKKNQVSDALTKEFTYKTYFSHKIIRYANVKFRDFEKIKVLVPQTSIIGNSFIDKNCSVSEDLFYIVCDTMKEANVLKKYLTSTLVQYIGKNYRPGRNLGSLLSANIIPNPELSQIEWTEEELEYIEANAK